MPLPYLPSLDCLILSLKKPKQQISEQDESFEDVLTSLENSRVTIENERAQIEAYKEQIEALKKQLETKQERLDERRDKILKNANEEAKRILAETKEYADQTMKLFHKFQKDHVDTAAVEKERQNIRARMNKADNALSIKAAPKEPKKKLSAKDLSHWRYWSAS